jgi:aspartate carbamoyltransferase catalytic subunit
VTLHFRSIEEAGTDRIHRLLDLTEHMAAVGRRPNPKVPALRGKTVCNLFFEDSTRTRMSFDLAAKRLSADTMTLAVSSSSVNKGESLRDTVETLDAMGVDAFVVRHRTSGVPWQVAGWTPAAVINAGDGWHAHPTQALLDAYTIRQRRGIANDFSGLKVAVVGDIRHSRVARSTTDILQLLGAEVVHVAPRTLLPPTSDVATTSNFDDVVGEVDVVYMLRMQRERMGAGLVPDGGEYSRRFALDERRAFALRSDALLMHPGPMNRGVEMMVDPTELPQSTILDQVTNGIAARMAVLFELLGSGGIEE